MKCSCDDDEDDGRSMFIRKLRVVVPQTGRIQILSPAQSSGLGRVSPPPPSHTPQNVVEMRFRLFLKSDWTS